LPCFAPPIISDIPGVSGTHDARSASLTPVKPPVNIAIRTN
jgi:hypothetical protein